MSYEFINADCFEWMQTQPPNSFTAIVTDPPYGVKEYTKAEMDKKRKGRGGIWRIPPSFDGHTRQPLPRFSVINDNLDERENVYHFFHQWAQMAIKLLVPGGHAFIAATPLLSDILSKSMRDAGFERRGEIIRTVATLRGGDRPKGAEDEFPDVSVIPRGVWEPWGLYRKPISERTVADNLRKWKAGALHRIEGGNPFSDLIESAKTPRFERTIAPHPSLKPQEFLRKIVRASLPLSTGVILDTFAGSGSTVAAAEFCGLNSVGVEKDMDFYNMGQAAIPQLANLYSTEAANNQEQVSLFQAQIYF
jgi:site-specific DNA-methyltransferase (adenine-specific)